MRILFLALIFMGFHKHDYHVSYGNMVVEDKSVTLSIRLFQDDFQQALRIYSGNPNFVLAVNESADEVVMRYFHQYLKIKTGNRQLNATLVSSSQKGDMWQYILSYQSQRSLQNVKVYNSVLMRLFEDQRNIFKVLFLPENSEQYYYYVKGAEEYTFRR